MELKQGLVRSADTVNNVLIALTHTDQEKVLRQKRIESIDMLAGPLANYMLYGGEEADRLQKWCAYMVQSQTAVIRSRFEAMKEIGIPGIVEELETITESGYPVGLASPMIERALGVQHVTLTELTELNREMLTLDESTTQRVQAIGNGVKHAIMREDLVTIQFVVRSLPQLIEDAQQTDRQVINMSEENPRWKAIELENNKLRQLLAQFM